MHRPQLSDHHISLCTQFRTGQSELCPCQTTTSPSAPSSELVSQNSAPVRPPHLPLHPVQNWSVRTLPLSDHHISLCTQFRTDQSELCPCQTTTSPSAPSSELVSQNSAPVRPPHLPLHPVQNRSVRTWPVRSARQHYNRTSALPDNALPDNALPDTALPDTALPDDALPDTALPDDALPDTALPDTALPDDALPDTALPDDALPDNV